MSDTNLTDGFDCRECDAYERDVRKLRAAIRRLTAEVTELRDAARDAIGALRMESINARDIAQVDRLARMVRHQNRPEP